MFVDLGKFKVYPDKNNIYSLYFILPIRVNDQPNDHVRVDFFGVKFVPLNVVVVVSFIHKKN